ncbi:predicted protein [Plenodomus lingam JN3]|uniref:Predicted protein n=1 Tax=Leptosphaeria maculans (strain JN3 / isolate v23.1.3 / race Av1-4-5-6-7-8) TaxID=985895 RepID=E4ZWL1_LEPMJ|nr:predicted protein [Plenodomus lingam JN3]CBX95987.1 predicted protein [Plenodomus lingam JN3]
MTVSHPTISYDRARPNPTQTKPSQLNPKHIPPHPPSSLLHTSPGNLTSSRTTSATTTPTASFAFIFDMHDDVHTLALEKLHGALADVFEVGGARGDDVNDA